MSDEGLTLFERAWLDAVLEPVEQESGVAHGFRCGYQGQHG